mgnify:CR=1 FL=1
MAVLKIYQQSNTLAILEIPDHVKSKTPYLSKHPRFTHFSVNEGLNGFADRWATKESEEAGTGFTDCSAQWVDGELVPGERALTAPDDFNDLQYEGIGTD